MEYLGNISLLDQLLRPSSGQAVHGFLCSRCTKSNVILPCLDWAVERAKGSEPVMSTFHSELESAVLDMLISGSCPIILVLGRRLYKKIPKRLQPLLDANRLLIISLSDQSRISRESAFICNKYICDNAKTLTFGFVSKESSLYSLYESVRSCKAWFQDTANKTLYEEVRCLA
ncbi:MAG: hypothetical protein MJZ32_11425 [Bacteroidaceae bacterium]|nr:hypothetical protein [Bacteroidaceae bacterium]